MNQPLVSIIIPVFNAEKHIDKTIASALNQTWPNKEIIVVDDGSTDNSLTILKKYENPWIRIYCQNNRGASAARNKGLEHARGHYIQFLDADDILGLDKISKQLEQLENNPGKVAVCSTVHFFDGTNPYHFTPSAYEETFLIDSPPVPFLINLWGGITKKSSMIQPNAWLTPSAIIAKAGKWNEELTLDDDGEFFCRVILASTGVVVTHNAFNYYRKTKGQSLSGKKDIKSLVSLYKSITLKHQYIQGFDCEIANKITATNLAVLLMYAYPVHKELADQVTADIEKLGGVANMPILGGKVIQLFMRIFGWKMARRMQHYYSRKFRS